VLPDPTSVVDADTELPFDVSRFREVSLSEVLASAAQLTRVDRKYLVPLDMVESLLDGLSASHRLLSIDGRSFTSYRSTYFDTADATTARAHVQGRRRRWKARSRLYVEDRLCRLEVKAKDARGVTVKTVLDSDPADYGRLSPDGIAFISSVLRDRSLDDARALRATAEVRYRRVTLADLEQSTRVTVDCGVTCSMDTGRVWVDRSFVLVETKGGVRPGEADRALTTRGVRPCAFSKYVAGVALLRDDVPANDFRVFFGRQLHAVQANELRATDSATAMQTDRRQAS
jgi:hypothetical protein